LQLPLRWLSLLLLVLLLLLPLQRWVCLSFAS
jgi:hypothetical protein